MVSEGSCDTEDWSNDAENSALITEINYILQNIKIENICFIYCIFNEIDPALVSRKYIQKDLGFYQSQTFYQ